MLQIRLNKGSAAEAGCPSANSAPPAETVTVACPDHLVLADLPVAKSLGAVTSSAASNAKPSIGRRSRRHLGERVHFCVRCDFPIAIYGRLVPCEHAFCLACARTDSSCYLCDERIQKIQTIKLMEGIFICAAPHCLKSFLKRTEFDAHIHEIHADLLHPNLDKEAANDTNAFNNTRPSSTDAQKQSVLPEISTARAPPRPGISPTSSSQHLDREERNRRHQSREPPTPRTPLQPQPPPFQNRQQPQPGDSQKDNAPQGFDRPYNWFPQPQSSPHFQQNTEQFSSDKTTGIAPETSFSNFMPQIPHQPPNYQLPMNPNQALAPTPFTYAPFPSDGSQPYYSAPSEMPRPELASESGSEQGSVLGIPPVPTGVPSFLNNFPRPWSMGLMGFPFQPLPMGQGIPEGFGNPTDPQAGVAFYQGDYGRMPEGLTMNTLAGRESEQHGSSAGDRNDGKGMLAPQSLSLLLPPPPPPLPPPLSQQQLNRGPDGQVYGWQGDKHGPN
ncbi:putative E3 ubiquitin-protein ligase Hakai [Iris pallida]|uniref:RING-type E3 ubiquitin transferase n=1 Tax=Iris pallida TaxID=29817 RepID=A0AAX6HFP0_IRIPA|nr:putative E3 ubiquitin-protein ligase Hakai [Iris pallida]